MIMCLKGLFFNVKNPTVGDFVSEKNLPKVKSFKTIVIHVLAIVLAEF